MRLPASRSRASRAAGSHWPTRFSQRRRPRATRLAPSSGSPATGRASRRPGRHPEVGLGRLGRPERGCGRCGRAASGRPRSGTRAGRPPRPRRAGHRERAAGRGRCPGRGLPGRGCRRPRGPRLWPAAFAPEVARRARRPRTARPSGRRRRAPAAEAQSLFEHVFNHVSVSSTAAWLQSRPRKAVLPQRRPTRVELGRSAARPFPGRLGHVTGKVAAKGWRPVIGGRPPTSRGSGQRGRGQAQRASVRPDARRWDAAAPPGRTLPYRAGPRCGGRG